MPVPNRQTHVQLYDNSLVLLTKRKLEMMSVELLSCRFSNIKSPAYPIRSITQLLILSSFLNNLYLICLKPQMPAQTRTAPHLWYLPLPLKILYPSNSVKKTKIHHHRISVGTIYSDKRSLLREYHITYSLRGTSSIE
jgi:hypothetical protein